jgi:hypothetical protein
MALALYWLNNHVACPPVHTACSVMISNPITIVEYQQVELSTMSQRYPVPHTVHYDSM